MGMGGEGGTICLYYIVIMSDYDTFLVLWHIPEELRMYTI